MVSTVRALAVLLVAVLLPPGRGIAQDAPQRTLHEGSAVVRTEGGDGEYTIRILCESASQPELGFFTEANRITRQATGGRSNMVNLRLRPWKDTDEVQISSTLGVVWIARPVSTGGVLSLTLDVVPASFLEDNAPVAMTYDRWTAGERPEGGGTLEFEANCGVRDPEAPSYRRLPDTGGGS
ncbi:MAG: hypothetical protein KJO44_03420 [Gemmatimonadetes bacterium]|nr:hypothetical protein [Gemmatimonadota bacterium]MBT8478655.1 hypothetical protein [Gemmatimonadota bacterium]NNK48785.1 hypothetical protein [Gemmatimonadota bacterium]